MKKFHIDHRNVRKITGPLCWAVVVVSLLSGLNPKALVPLLIVDGLLVLVIGVLSVLFWRCPYCERRLPGSRTIWDGEMEYCPYCGKSLR